MRDEIIRPFVNVSAAAYFNMMIKANKHVTRYHFPTLCLAKKKERERIKI